MKLVAVAKLLPTPEQRTALLATLERFNQACDWLAGEAFAAQLASKYTLQAHHYRTLRHDFGLSAQMAVRALAKVSEAYTRDTSHRPHFRPRGAIPYDPRIYSFKGRDQLSVLTLGGRAQLPFVAGGPHAARLGPDVRHGQADLVLRKGRWYFEVSLDVPAPTSVPTADVLGVDLGLRNLATDSDGARYSGAAVEAVRVRLLTLRTALQACGTRSARKHLTRLAGKEARFRANTNHTVSKRLVRKAQDTARALALEDLQGIGARTPVRKSQRARHGGWAFFQLRAFVTYKAQLAGVPLVLIDPRNTSRTCPECGHCARSNRRSQAEFVCKSCGFAQHADVVGARNLARRAAVHQPFVSRDDGGKTGALGRGPRSSADASPRLAASGGRRG